MRRSLLIGLMTLGTLTGVIQGTTMASFTDRVTSTGNVFSSGTVSIGATGATNNVLTTLSFSNMIPGDTVTAPLTIQNSGTLALTYNLDVSATADSNAQHLSDALKLTIRHQDSSSCTNSGFGSSGDPIYATGLLVRTGLFGSNRPIPVSGVDNLCFQVTLPSTVGTAYQAGSATVTFSFLATS